MVDSGLGGGYYNTYQLKPMKYDETMAADKKGWTKEVNKEHQLMIENNFWRPMKLENFLKVTKIITSTWAWKLKPRDRKQKRLNAILYEKINGIYYD